MYKLALIFSIATCILYGCNKSQKVPANPDFFDGIQLLVLQEKQPGQEYFFKVPVQEGVLEYKIKYIGELTTTKGDTLKFLNSTILTGYLEDSKRASCVVAIYDSADKKLGFYYVGGIDGLPDTVNNGNLVFNINSDDCDHIEAINFRDSIPQQIYVRCSKDGGDIWTFAEEN